MIMISASDKVQGIANALCIDVSELGMNEVVMMSSYLEGYLLRFPTQASMTLSTRRDVVWDKDGCKLKSATYYVDGEYFTQRLALTLSEKGVEVGAWADEMNASPIIDAFSAWAQQVFVLRMRMCSRTDRSFMRQLYTILSENVFKDALADGVLPEIKGCINELLEEIKRILFELQREQEQELDRIKESLANFSESGQDGKLAEIKDYLQQLHCKCEVEKTLADSRESLVYVNGKNNIVCGLLDMFF